MKHCPTCHRCYEDGLAVCTEDHSALVESRPGALLLAGKYRLEEFLGRGDQGAAYEATALADGRSVIAVELTRVEVLADPQALERFHSAAQAAGRNNGQEVGEVRDSGLLPGGAYVVMDLIDGEAEGLEGAVGEPDKADTPTVVSQAPNTGRLRPPGRNTGKLSKVAAEITQEVRRIPMPIPHAPSQPPPDAQDTAPVKASDITRVVNAPPLPHAAPARQNQPDAGAQSSAPIVVAVPRETNQRETKRRRPIAFYLGLALIGLACVLLLVYAFSRLRRGSAAAPAQRTAAAQPTAAQPTASQPTPPTALPAQQAAAPASVQTTAAVSPDGAPPPAASGDGAAAAARSAPRGASRGDADVREVLDDWVAAVTAQDVNKLMSFYAPVLDTFYDRRDVASSSLRAELTRLFGRAERVDARVLGEPRITFGEGGRAATVRIRLSYTVQEKGGRKRQGEVAQELRLSKVRDGWKISGQRGETMLR
jgi:ketosteroid isomerase-like protein